MKLKDRTCGKCKRILQESIHDKCMFCGEPIPEIFQLSEVKKEEIRKKIDEREKKRIKDKNPKEPKALVVLVASAVRVEDAVVGTKIEVGLRGVG